MGCVFCVWGTQFQKMTVHYRIYIERVGNTFSKNNPICLDAYYVLLGCAFCFLGTKLCSSVYTYGIAAVWNSWEKICKHQLKTLERTSYQNV